MTNAELLSKGYAILEGEADDNLSKAEWRRFQELRDEAEEAEFLEAEDKFYDEEAEAAAIEFQQHGGILAKRVG